MTRTGPQPDWEPGAESHGASDGVATLPARCDRCHAPAPVFEHAYWGEVLCTPCALAAADEYDVEGWPKAADDWPASESAAVLGPLWGLSGRLGLQWAERGRLWVTGHPVSGTTKARDLVELALRRNRRQVWLHRDALRRLGLPESIPPPARELVGSEWLEGSGVHHLGPWMRFRVGRHTVNVAVPSWETRRQVGERPLWDRAPTTEELFAELSAFEAAVGHGWVHSGAVTSDAMLRDHWHGRITRAVLPEPKGEDLARPGLEQVDSWAMAADNIGADHPARWCYAFDLGGMFLGAASGLALPVGPPVHTGASAPQPILPGYWLVGERWVTTPALGDGDGLWDAWVYPEHHQFLQPWYKALRDARAQLCPGSVALAAVKAVYTQGIGRLGSGRRADLADPLFQPYWRHAVVAEARERLRRRLAGLDQSAGVVVAVDTDALFVLSTAQDARVLALRLGLPLGAGLGQYHVLGRCPARQARELLAGRGIPRRSTIISELRKAVGGGGD